jgi:predicted NAD/FAD-binding protein
MRIAIVGAGIAGLTCAHELGGRHDVTLYEAAPRLGGHANTIDVEVAGVPHSVDTGFIVYNEATYPEFTRLLATLEVETQLADMSFGLSCERSGLEWSSRGVRGLFASPFHALRPRFVRMLAEIARFSRAAPGLLASGDEKVTLGDFLSGRGYSQAFREWYAIPMGAAIWSSGADDLLDMPAASFVRFFANHGLLGAGGAIQWRTLRGGSRSYVDALASRLRASVRTRCAIRHVAASKRGVSVVTQAGVESFDRVVLAVHADVALSLLASPTQAQRHLLSAFRYSRNDTVLHTDRSLLPRRSAAQASWNYSIPASDRKRVLVTYDLSRLQRIPSSKPLLVTLNGSDRIDPAQVLARFEYSHPILDSAAIAAQQHHREIDSVGGVHFCGAYWGSGFHEDGLRSALRVVSAIDGSA